MTVLPAAYERRMRAQLGAEADAYFAALDAPYTRGLRANPFKQPDVPLADCVEGLFSCIPWEPDGYALAPESRAGALPLHEAGAYYLQEPSAMVPARALCPRPGETVLDLCAAPGGKSTQMASMLAGDGLLVCNEPIPSRAQVLSRNLERMGVPNALVVSAAPERLASAWPGLFDAVLVDAPCGGEGMFRRHPETRLAWTESTPEGCAARQRDILTQAVALLKPGGRLCYSTCTFAQAEDEQNVAWLLREHPELSPLPFCLPGVAPSGEALTLDAPDGTLKLYPHRVLGEGHFVALLQKANDSDEIVDNVRPSAELLPADRALAPVSAAARAAYAAFCGQIGLASPPLPTACIGGALVGCPAIPPVAGLKLLRAGVRLGEHRSGRFEPDHALAMTLLAHSAHHADLTDEQALRFLSGEALPVSSLTAEPPPGYLLVVHHGLPLGWAKHADSLLKNHYPKGLRRGFAPAP